MNEKDKYVDLLYAFSLGCLDKEDLVKLLEYFESGGEYLWQELGEYQNLISLFPVILKTEKPGPELKDKVARKLYRLKTGKNKPKTAVKPETPQPEKIERENIPPEPSNLPATEKKEIEGTEKTETDASEREEAGPNPDDFEEVKFNKPENILLSSLQDTSDSAGQTAGKNQKPGGSKITETAPTRDADGKRLKEHEIEIGNTHEFSERQILQPVVREKKKTNFWLIFAFILFLLIAAGMFYLYINISNEVKNYKSGIVSLNQKINSLSSKITENRDLTKVLQAKDIKIVNLQGTDLSPNSFGKLIIGTVNMNCILQLSGLPTLSGNTSYQLWMNNGGQYVSLGVFNPTKDVEYFHFTLPTQTLDQVDFKLTQEPSSGSDTPGKMVYLTGNLK